MNPYIKTGTVGKGSDWGDMKELVLNFGFKLRGEEPRKEYGKRMERKLVGGGGCKWLRDHHNKKRWWEGEINTMDEKGRGVVS